MIDFPLEGIHHLYYAAHKNQIEFNELVFNNKLFVL